MKIDLFDINIDNLSMRETLERVGELISSGRVHQHIVVNVNKIVRANKNAQLKDIINNCDLVNVDGMLLVWASRILGKPLKERVAGVDLFLNLINKAAKNEWKLFFLGAKIETLKKSVDNLRKIYPSLKIVGYRDGYWRRDEEAGVAEVIKNAQPDILFVGISSPKKEYFLSEYLGYMKVPFAMGIGGSFDVLAGETKRAPLWMQNCGMEWFFRFLQEPKRLFKRYFIEGPYFLKILSKELINRK